MLAKKHILFFIFSMAGGGAERVTANLANHWAVKGHRVTIVTLKDASHDAYNLNTTITRISLGMDGKSPSALMAMLNNYRRIKALRRCLRQLAPDVGIAMMPTANCLLALSGKGLKTKRLGSERAFPPMLPLGALWEIVRRISYRNLDHVVTQTSMMMDWVIKNTSARSVKVIHNPVHYPLPYSTPVVASSEHLGADRNVLLSVGRLAPEKAFDRLLRAFAELTQRFPHWDLAIVGEGPSRVQLENLAAELGISDRVIMPGRAGNIAEWYNRADLFALTSKFEGFPNALIEAMAHGLPVVSVDCDTGPREIIHNGVDGLLVPQDSQRALVEGLERMIKNKEIRRAYGERAILIRDRLATQTIAEQWEALF